MRALIFMTIAFSMLFLIRCGTENTLDSNGNTDGLQSTFSSINSEVIQKQCAVSGCHGGGSASAGLSLASDVAYDNLVNVTSTENPSLKRVNPGNSAQSYLIFKLNGDGTSVMPPSGALSSVIISTIRQWIDNGAKND